jgi:electron transfer flavoprotein beta subunit
VTDNLKYVVNPFDEIAIEEALRLKAAQAGSEVVLVGIGSKAAAEQLRTGLAMGADRAALVLAEEELDSLAVARVLHKLVQDEGADIVIMGKQAIDDDANQTGQMLAALLGWPQATFASKLVLTEGEATVTREIDGGLETLALPLPAVVTTDLRLTAPRYATLPNIMKAKKKPLDTLKPADLGVDPAPRVTTLRVEEPPVRQAGVKVSSVAELVDKLRNHAKVIS